MASNWTDIVSKNVRKIVQAAQLSGEAEPVCVLVDIDDARAGKAALGVSQLIVDTKLHGAVPLADPENRRRIACLPVSRDRLLSTLEQSEEVGQLRDGLKTGGTLVLWAVCFAGDDRICLDIHLATCEAN